MPNFSHLKVGDKVTRLLAGSIPMEMTVLEVKDGVLMCGNAYVSNPAEAWTFDVATGAEIDEYLGWGPKFGRTGSYLVLESYAGFERERPAPAAREN